MPKRTTTNEYFAEVLELASSRLCFTLSHPVVDPLALWQEALLNKAIACAIEELLCPPPATDPPEPDE